MSWSGFHFIETILVAKEWEWKASDGGRKTRKLMKTMAQVRRDEARAVNGR